MLLVLLNNTCDNMSTGVVSFNFVPLKSHRGIVSVEGLEPSTNGLKGHCSAIELHAQTGCILSREVNCVKRLIRCRQASALLTFSLRLGNMDTNGELYGRDRDP